VMRQSTTLVSLFGAIVLSACGGGHATPAAAPSTGPAAGNAAAPPPMQSGPATSLYRRLGGYDAIAAVTDEFIARMIADPQLGSFFAQLSTPEKQRLRQMVVDQLCTVTGGPCVYVGKDMKSVHKALGITQDDWDIAVRHLVATLTKFDVPAREQRELLTIVSSVKGDIVTQ
ncbi:MAG TPA: group 1 truncated hemoglobin, partial [Gemmatimonadales bacterium]